MAQPVFYQTINMTGVDPTIYYTVSASATPETPAPPFVPGTQAFGSDGSQFVFVQASTSISLGDFVIINTAATPAPYQANSITSTNVATSLPAAFGATGLVVKQSVTNIPAAAYFWACTRGQYIPAQTNNGLASNAGAVTLFTSATAGVITSVTTSSTLALGIAGVVCINSLTVSIPSSVVPPVGTLTSTGFTLGPVVALNNPRAVTVIDTAAGLASLKIYPF